MYSLSSIDKCVNLEILDVSYNQLQGLEPISKLNTLKKCYLHFNSLKTYSDLSPLYALAALQELTIRGNPLDKFSENEKYQLIKQCQQLRLIDGKSISRTERNKELK